ncbi:MAG: hypothetical protein ACYDEN_09330 [Acidimicrobiales bacterium]
MAELVIDATDLVLSMRRPERLWSFRRSDLRLPLRAVRRARAVPIPWLELRGWRVDGVAVPGWVAMGRRRHGTGYDFTLVRGSGPAVVVELNGQTLERLVFSAPDAEAVAARIAAAAGIAG